MWQAGADRLVIAGGNVGIGTQAPSRALHVEGSEIHVGGPNGGLSFATRDVAGFVDQPGATGSRWVWFASGGSAHLWSGSPALSVSAAGVLTTRSGLVCGGGIELNDQAAIHGAGQLVIASDATLLMQPKGDVQIGFGERIAEDQSSATADRGILPTPTDGGGNLFPVPEVDVTDRAYDTRVCGVVEAVHGEMAEVEARQGAGKGSKTLQPRLFEREERAALDATTVQPGQVGGFVTLGAYAHCKVDADIAPIVAGDLLTTSPTKAHAQKVLDRTEAAGAVIGKALGGLAEGRGKIPIFVTLH